MKNRMLKRLQDLKKAGTAGLSMIPSFLEAFELDRAAYWIRRGLHSAFESDPMLTALNTVMLARTEWEKGRSSRATRLIAELFRTLDEGRWEAAERPDMFPHMLAAMFLTFGDQFKNKDIELPPIALQLIEEFVDDYLEDGLLPPSAAQIRPLHFKQVGNMWMKKQQQEQSGEDILSGYYVAVVVTELATETDSPRPEERILLVRAPDETTARELISQDFSAPPSDDDETVEPAPRTLKEVTDISPVRDESLSEITSLYARPI